MPLIKSPSRAAVGQNIEEMQDAGHPHRQAVAAALSNARRYGAKFDEGGAALPLTGFPGTGAAPFSGPVNSSVPGRTDRHHVGTKPGSYVIPADIVSGLGEGNTAAGHKALTLAFPKPLHPHGHMHQPHMAHVKAPHSPHLARGGRGERPVPIVIAGGEHVLEPEQIQHAFGDLDKGHKKLDEWVVHERRRINKEQAKLPGPKR
jgi:hypothetical protein